MRIPNRTRTPTNQSGCSPRKRIPDNSTKTTIMAELNQGMANMGISDSAHAQGSAPPVKAAYIPPHMRGVIARGGPPAAAPPSDAPAGPAAANGIQQLNSRWATGYASEPCFP